jgi:DNA-binding transcriptional ArsR family regulator
MIKRLVEKQTIRKELERHRELERCADAFGVVGDLTRLKICWLLCHHPELSVGEIAEVLSMDISTVSHALRKLREAGVVSRRRATKQVFYALERSPLCTFLKKAIT